MFNSFGKSIEFKKILWQAIFAKARMAVTAKKRGNLAYFSVLWQNQRCQSENGCDSQKEGKKSFGKIFLWQDPLKLAVTLFGALAPLKGGRLSVPKGESRPIGATHISTKNADLWCRL